MPKELSKLEVQHLLNRIGFGDSKNVIDSYVGQTSKEILQDQFHISKSYSPIELNSSTDSTLEAFLMSDTKDKREMQKVFRENIRFLNSSWLGRMANERSGVLDKMALFWHDHFACSSRNPQFTLSYVQTLRKHALGNFGDLLKAVSKEPAMLQYLNNQQNRKKAPNENFAREVMELFTLGRDRVYSENDIKEAARAFTGWGFNRKGDFVFRQFAHDFSDKNFLGKKGNFDGDDILDILLKRKETSDYIAEKLVAYFVNPEGDSELQDEVSEVLFSSDYDIKETLNALFSNRFFESRNIGVRIKSPIELIVGTQRINHLKIEDETSLLYLQRFMGQVLFYPPNVSGWPDGKSWVDSSTLMFRLNLPDFLFRAGYLTYQPADSFDANNDLFVNNRLKKLVATIDFDSLQSEFEGLSLNTIWNYYNQLPSSLNLSNYEALDLKSKLILVMSQPEYQLC